MCRHALAPACVLRRRAHGALTCCRKTSCSSRKAGLPARGRIGRQANGIFIERFTRRAATPALSSIAIRSAPRCWPVPDGPFRLFTTWSRLRAGTIFAERPTPLSGRRNSPGGAVVALAERKACLLANHGQIALGRDIDAAFELAHEVETRAAQYVQLLKLGEVNLLLAREFPQPLPMPMAPGLRQRSDLPSWISPSPKAVGSPLGPSCAPPAVGEGESCGEVLLCS